MYNVLILWAPDTSENHRIVDMVARAFEDSKIVPRVKKAAEANTADINGSEVVIFGVQKAGAAEVPPEYTELVRSFKGVTFAGRTAGFFSTGPEKSTAKLRKALKDTEIAQTEDDPLFADQKDGVASEVAEWARRIVAAHQELKYVRA
jgi:hypothetical protein